MNPAALLWGSLGITFAAQNCNSLNVVSSIKNQDLKLSAIIGYKHDIIFLSDTRFNGRDGTICDRLKLWYNVYHNSTKNCRGVAVLIGKQVEHEIIDTAADPQENVLLIRLKIRGAEMAVGAVYGPNTDVNAADFFGFIRNTLNNWQNIPYVLGGDWNLTYSCLPLNENPDVLFMRNLPSINSRVGIKKPTQKNPPKKTQKNPPKKTH